MKNLKFFTIAAAFSILGISPASSATIFTDADAFSGATSGVTTETFDADISGPGLFDPNATIVFAGGTTSTASNNRQFNEVMDGAFFGGTRAGRTDEFDNTITFDFGREITAFGGFFTDASPILVSGMFDGALTEFLLGDIRSDDGFIGLTSTTGFSEIIFSTNTGGFLPFGNPTVSLQAINFGLDDFSTGEASAGISPIPLPASALLLLGALGGLGATRKLRRRK